MSNKMPKKIVSSSSVEDDSVDYVFYFDRPEWSDIKPIPQNDGQDPVVSIHYSVRFNDVYSMLRAVMKAGEKSARVLELTSEAIILNAANYTAWQYRREVLMELGIPSLITKDGLSSEFSLELDFSKEMIEENQKNYQVWHHRKILISWASGFNEELGKVTLKCSESRSLLVEMELELTESILARDAKNYHAWQHRQWILIAFDYFDQELKFVDFLLEGDVRNNSAWNQRFFVITNSTKFEQEIIEAEIQKTWQLILRAPSNESPWNYLKGIFTLNHRVQLKDHKDIENKCEEMVKSETKSVPLYSFLIEIYEEKLEDSNVDSTTKKLLLNKVDELCSVLCQSLDIQRKKFWDYVRNRIFETYEEEALPAK